VTDWRVIALVIGAGAFAAFVCLLFGGAAKLSRREHGDYDRQKSWDGFERPDYRTVFVNEKKDRWAPRTDEMHQRDLSPGDMPILTGRVDQTPDTELTEPITGVVADLGELTMPMWRSTYESNGREKDPTKAES
jgi:hypothetical protein